MKKLNRMIAAAVVLLVVAGTPALKAEDVIEQYRAWAVAMGTVATGARTTVDVGIYRYTTDAERDAFVQILKEKGAAALNEAMFNAPQVAFLKVSGSLGYKLRFVREVPDKSGKKHLILIADRPITFKENVQNTRSKDYNFTVIELIVDEQGKGEGALAVGIAMNWNADNNKLELETYGSEATRLMSVSRLIPK